MKHGKIAKGFQSMARLRAHPIIGARDYYYSYIIYVEELKLAGGLNYFTRLWDCFRVPRIRRANYGASTVMIAQQMCGINSKSPLVSFQCLALTPCSHLFLQLNYFRKRRLHTGPGLVRVSWLRCYSGHIHYPYSVPHRYQRSKNPDFDCESLRALRKYITDPFLYEDFPLHVPLSVSCWSVSSEQGR